MFMVMCFARLPSCFSHLREHPARVVGHFGKQIDIDRRNLGMSGVASALWRPVVELEEL